MRLLADLHISPGTVSFLNSLGHDVVRVSAVLAATSADELIVAHARQEHRTILTQDLDFSSIIAITGGREPSLITLRLSSSRVEHVNEVLRRVLPSLESDVRIGMLITVEDHRVRRRELPLG